LTSANEYKGKLDSGQSEETLSQERRKVFQVRLEEGEWKTRRG